MASLSIINTLHPSPLPHSNSSKPISSLNFTPTHYTKQSSFKHIYSLCKNAQIQQAIHLLSDIETNNLHIGPDIYGELLQGCVYDRNLSLGQQIHAKIIKDGKYVAKNEFVETKLLILYSKCDVTEVATRLFCRLSKQSVFSWAAIIGLYCRKGLYESALLGFCEMGENGIMADNFVIPNVLKACGALMVSKFGEGVHGYTVKMGFDRCVYVASSLIDMYGKCGVVDYAQKVFDKMHERNVVAWNSVIVSYVQNGMNEEAIEAFYDMRMEGIEPSRVTFVSFLSACANLCAQKEGKQGHAISVTSALTIDNILGSSLINFYSKVGLIDDAETIFSLIPDKDVVTWNLLISCYVQYNYIERALDLCHVMRSEGFKFDSVTLSSILSASTVSNNFSLGREAHCYCIKNDLAFDVVLASSIITMYATCERIDKARIVFDSVKKKDLVMWNSLLAAYAERGLSGETLSLFYQMQLECVPPNLITWNTVILGLFRNGKVDQAMEILAEMKSLEVQPNVITYTTIIAGLSQNGFVDEAILKFKEMQEKRIELNIVCITSVLSACTKTSSLLRGQSIHGYIVRHGLCLSILLATSLVDMYSKCGNLDLAKKVFDNIVAKELPLYNALISGYALHGCAFEALSLFKHMLNNGVEPDSITFTCVLSACTHAGMVKEGLEIFDEMVKKQNEKLSMEHYGCVVSLLSRCGNLQEAVDVVVKMPFSADSRILGSLLAACRECNEVELGEYLVQRLNELEPGNSGNYVALSNTYAIAGKWDEMSVVRCSMKEKGVRKSPGCSWIQIGSEIHTFVARDSCHSQIKEIYTMLDLLKREMQLMG